jgi:AcrR family transcriptional regulator
MSADERREQILGAALSVFAEGGYAGTTTDQVARAAGVSQPYVVRMFGTKQQLFAEVYARACHRIAAAFDAIEPGPDADQRLGHAYVDLLQDRDLLLMMMHGFVAGADPEIGRIARKTLAYAFRTHQRLSGATPDESRQFVAHGMLLNVLIASGALEHLGEDADFDELTSCALGDAVDTLRVASSS